MAGARVLVVGDVMLDQFTIGRVTRISPEAPVPVVAFERDEFRAGGAANVALNVRALGAHVDLIGLVGADEAATRLRELLSVADVPASGIISDEQRRTTTKVRIVTTRNQQVARVDYESEEAASEPVEDALIQQIEDSVRGAGAVIVSDYLKGLITRRLMTSVIAAAQEAWHPGPGRSQDPAPRSLRRRDDRHAESSRGGSSHAHAHPHRRGR